jgi:hypothetical protein
MLNPKFIGGAADLSADGQVFPFNLLLAQSNGEFFAFYISSSQRKKKRIVMFLNMFLNYSAHVKEAGLAVR